MPAHKEFADDGAMPRVGNKFPTLPVSSLYRPQELELTTQQHTSATTIHVTEIDAAQTAAACKKQWLGCLMSIQDDAERPTFPRWGVQKQRELFASSNLPYVSSTTENQPRGQKDQEKRKLTTLRSQAKKWKRAADSTVRQPRSHCRPFPSEKTLSQLYTVKVNNEQNIICINIYT